MEKGAEDEFTLTSFEALSPEQEKSGFFRFIEELTKKKLKWTTDKQDQSSTAIDKAKDGTQFHPRECSFNAEQVLPRKTLKAGNSLPWKPRQSSGVQPKSATVPSNRNTRTPSSVLRRLSLLVLVEKTSHQPSQSRSNLKQYWMPDEQCKICYECGVKFNTFRRRHHCRLCGQIFCSKCCNEELSGHLMGYTGVLRVCIYCKKIVLAYTSSSDIDNNLKQLKEDLSLVSQPDITNSPGHARMRISTYDDPELNRAFDVFGVSAEEANLLKQDSFKELWQQITGPKIGVDFQSHRIRLRTYSNCLVGRDLVDWLLIYRKAPNRYQAQQICQGLQDFGWIEPLVNARESGFKDDVVLYIPGPSATGENNIPGFRTPLSVCESLSSDDNSDDFFPDRNFRESQKREASSFLSESYDKRFTGGRREGFHKSISTPKLGNAEKPFVLQFQNKSLSCEELFLKVDAVGKEENEKGRRDLAPTNTQSPVLDDFVFVEDCYLPKRLALQQANSSKNAAGSEQEADKEPARDRKLFEFQRGNEEISSFNHLSAIHHQHISSFLSQLLDRVNLSHSWKAIIEPLVLRVSETVFPDVPQGDDMDIRQFVKIKKISGGAKSDCRIVNGVVCTKNVIHKKMAKSLTQPQILMLACPVDFQRVENKLASLDSLVLQEEEFLKNFVARIVDLQPSIVLVEKTVSRLAQDMLLAKGISVMLNMKPKLMGRISRCTEGDVLPSLDQGRRPRLGTCQKFKIQKFVLKNGNTKTVAFFEGCQPYLGSTIVIRGGNRSELSRIKHILKFMLFVAYNSKLEKAFVMDEFGTPYRNENKQADEERQNGEGLVEDKSGTYSWREGEPVQKKTKNEEQLEKEESGTSSWKEGDPVKKKAKNEESPIEDKFGTGHRKERELIEKGRQNCEVKPGDELWSEEANVVKERTVTAENTCSNDTGDNSVVNGKSFKRISDKVILCSSPLIYYPVPYLLTLEGQRCKLLSYMPDDLYWSPMFSGEAPLEHFSSEEDDEDDVKKSENENIFIKETHPFVHAVWTNGPRDLESRKLLAHFRAEGGKIILKRLRPMINGEGTVPFQNDVDDIDETGEAVEVQMTDTLDLESCDSAPADEQYPMTSTLKRDCFDPFLHQMIAILFSSYAKESGNFPNPCISPWTVFMEFYVKNDIALGCFLETYCFRSSYLCPNPNCDVPMVKHVRYFAHGDGAVYINMRNLESPIPGFSKTLLTWSWCKECKQVTPVVPVSPEAWRLSFAKYLELRIYGNCYRRRATDAPCDHSLHQDHFQYFAFNNIVASFKYVPVKIYEVYLPPSTITLLEQEREPQFWIKHIQAMSVRVHQLVNSTNDRIASLKTESFISNCVTEIGHDQGQLHEKIKVLESKAMLLLSPPSSPGASNESKLLEPHEVSSLEYEILDGITLLKRKMCVLGDKWNAQLLELLQVENEKKKSKTTEGKNSVQPTSQSPIESGNLGHISEDSVYSNWFENSVQQGDSKGSLSRSDSVVVSDNHDTAKNIEEVSQSPDVKKCTNLAGQTLIEDEQTSSSSESETEAKLDMLNGPRGSGSSCEKQLQKHSELWATLSREVDTSLKGEQLQEDRPGPTMKRIISHILPGVNFRAIPSPFPLHEHHLLPSSEMIPIVVNEKEPTSIIAYTLSTIDYNTKLCKIQESMMEMESDESAYIDLELDGVRRLSKNAQSETISTRSRTRSELETLSSTSLMASLDDFMDNYFGCSDSDNEENGPKNDTSKVFPAGKPARDEISENKSPNTKEGLPTSDVDGKEQSSTLNSSTQEEVEYHIRHSFSDSSAKFYCVIYFGEQFRRLRKSVFPDGEERYIRSLQYCLKWRVTGGKSGSSFCKTTDDRFVIKEMSRSEAQSFLNIAPYYFDYIEKTLKEKRPTLLAKIFGVYRIGFTSKITNATIRKDLLVMDNLFYNCHVNKVFDLKGSIRSRYVAMSSEKENNVLMDENLLEMIAESPLFIRPHSKAVLSRAINRDTEFLARHMVMDYSLLLGIEQDTCKLIVGIIDFIRTFTWDKKLEMYVKSTGILGGQGKMPTVVSPELYRERFCEAMQRYFLMIPSKWMGLGNELK